MRPISQAVPGGLVELLRSMPLSHGKVEFAWKAAVGPALQRATHVKLEGTLLIVEAVSPQWGQEVRRSSRVILSRLQAWLGSESVTAITVRT
jgi:predicted nucleic acid-binding Zn ribbon protein